MKCAFYKILFIFLLVAQVADGQAQICLERIQFPYIYKGWSDNSNPIEDEWWQPSPYAELIKRKQIKAIHIIPAQEYSADSMTFFFSRNAILDSINVNIYSWKDSTLMKLHHEFLYNEDQQIKRINYYQDSLLFSFIEIDYKNGLPYFTRQKIPLFKKNEGYSIDTVYTWFAIDKNNKLSELYSLQDSLLSSDTFRLIDKQSLFCWNLSDTILNKKPNASPIIIQKYSNHAVVSLQNGSGKILSQSNYVYFNEDTLLSEVSNLIYNKYGILMNAQTYSFSHGFREYTSCLCRLNEDNLPDTIFKSDTIVFHYEYYDSQSRWSPCNNAGKRMIEDWVSEFDNVALKPDSAFSKNVRKIFRCEESIVKAIAGSDTCWFRNDYLVFLENETEEFWFNGDSIISFRNKDGRPVSDIISLRKKAVKKKEYIYQEIKKLFPAFGVRVLLLNKEPQASLNSYDNGKSISVSLLIRIYEEEVDSIKRLAINDSSFEITRYVFTPMLPGADIIDWICDSAFITEREMRCLKNKGLTRVYFSCVVIDKKTRKEYSIPTFGLRIIRNKK